MLSEELSHADKAVSFLSINKKQSYFLNNDKFLEDEGKFNEFFMIHHPTRKTVHLMTIGCILRTTKTLSEMKKSVNPATSILKWLQENKVFIAVDLIGHHATRIVRNIINIHPHIMHHASLRESLFNALQATSITKEEVIALSPSAAAHYELTMDSGDETVTFIPPFKIFLTRISFGLNTDKVITEMISIASAAHHHKLLNELTT